MHTLLKNTLDVTQTSIWTEYFCNQNDTIWSVTMQQRYSSAASRLFKPNQFCTDPVTRPPLLRDEKGCLFSTAVDYAATLSRLGLSAFGGTLYIILLNARQIKDNKTVQFLWWPPTAYQSCWCAKEGGLLQISTHISSPSCAWKQLLNESHLAQILWTLRPCECSCLNSQKNCYQKRSMV